MRASNGLWQGGVGGVTEGKRLPSVTDHVAAVDRSADERSRTGADDRAQRLRSAGSDDVAEHAAADAANDQASGAVVPPAVVAVVGAAVDAIVSAQPSAAYRRSSRRHEGRPNRLRASDGTNRNPPVKPWSRAAGAPAGGTRRKPARTAARRRRPHRPRGEVLHRPQLCPPCGARRGVVGARRRRPGRVLQLPGVRERFMAGCHTRRDGVRGGGDDRAQSSRGRTPVVRGCGRRRVARTYRIAARQLTSTRQGRKFDGASWTTRNRRPSGLTS